LQPERAWSLRIVSKTQSIMTCHKIKKLTKRKRKLVLVAIFYGRFLTTIIITAPTMAIAMIIAAVEATKYISVGGKVI
jgi:hypothetical protein